MATVVIRKETAYPSVSMPMSGLSKSRQIHSNTYVDENLPVPVSLYSRRVLQLLHLAGYVLGLLHDCWLMVCRNFHRSFHELVHFYKHDIDAIMTSPLRLII